jgi:predicted DNA-binding antitoxin AbrB/MazE fold protein
MVKLRLRYEGGQLIPLTPLIGLSEGEEIEVEWHVDSSFGTIQAMLAKSAGAWADLEDIEEFLDTMRQQWDEEWQQRLNS